MLIEKILGLLSLANIVFLLSHLRRGYVIL
jgi:hypothetical protein